MALQAVDYAMMALAFGPLVGGIALFAIIIVMVTVKGLFGR